MELQNELRSQAALSAMMAELGPPKTKKVVSSCPECQQNSRVGRLKEYYVDLEESLLLCDNEQCCYTSSEPPDIVQSSYIDDTDLNDILSSFSPELPIESSSVKPSDNNKFSLTDSFHSQFTELHSPQKAAMVPGRCVNSTSSLSHSSFHSARGSQSISPFNSCNQPTISSTDTSGIFSGSTSSASAEGEGDSSLLPTSLSFAQSSPAVTDSSCISSSPKNQYSNATANSSLQSQGTGTGIVTSANDFTVTHVPDTPKTVSPAVCTENTNRQHYVMLWYNLDALCWLDVLLAVLCQNHSLRSILESLPYSSVIKKLLLAYDESQALIEPLQAGGKSLLHSIMENDKQSVKRGGGYCMNSSSALLDSISRSTVLSSQEISQAKRKIHLAGIKLECAREEMWQAIEPLLRCERGKDDSPVFAFPVMVKAEKEVEQLFLTEYTWTVKCTICHHTQVTSEKKHMITFPKIAEFEMNQSMSHYRACVKCLAPNQKRTLNITRLSHNLVIHFSEGVLDSDVNTLTFVSGGMQYVVSAVIEYKTSPNHFALWHRDFQHNQPGNWMCYDDLRSQYAQHSIGNLSVPASNIHIVFWEAVNELSKDMSRPTSAESLDTTTKVETIHDNISGESSPPEPMPIKVMECSNQQSCSKSLALQDAGADTTTNIILTKNMDTAVSSVSPVASLTAPPLPCVSKVLKNHSKRDAAQPVHANTPRAKKKTAVPLLSAPLGSKPPLASAIQYASQTPIHIKIDTSGSNDAVMAALSQMTPFPASDSSSQSMSNEKVAKGRPKITATRSYLDIVKPLIQRNKEQKGKVLTGYVPKSKREPLFVPNNSKRKKVVFTGVPAPSSSTTAPPEITHTPVVDRHVPTTLVHSSSYTKAKQARTRTATTIIDNFVPYSEKKLKLQKQEPIERDDMPSLEDMLKDIC